MTHRQLFERCAESNLRPYTPPSLLNYLARAALRSMGGIEPSRANLAVQVVRAHLYRVRPPHDALARLLFFLACFMASLRLLRLSFVLSTVHRWQCRHAAPSLQPMDLQ